MWLVNVGSKTPHEYDRSLSSSLDLTWTKSNSAAISRFWTPKRQRLWGPHPVAGKRLKVFVRKPRLTQLLRLIAGKIIHAGFSNHGTDYQWVPLPFFWNLEKLRFAYRVGPPSYKLVYKPLYLPLTIVISSYIYHKPLNSTTYKPTT